jgi:HdeA/HdeB family
MKPRFAAMLLPLLLGAACAQQPPPPPPATPAAPPAPSAAQVGPGQWDVERVRCSDLLEASDADRASAAMFYYGYLAAKAGIQVIDVSRIDGNIAKVMQQCETAPNLTVPQAFREALRPGS